MTDDVSGVRSFLVSLADRGRRDRYMDGTARTFVRPTSRIASTRGTGSVIAVAHTLSDHGLTTETIHHDTTNHYVRATQ